MTHKSYLLEDNSADSLSDESDLRNKSNLPAALDAGLKFIFELERARLSVSLCLQSVF